MNNIDRLDQEKIGMEALAKSARKITFTLFIAHSLTSAAVIAMATLNAIVGADLGESARWAGVPSAVYLLAGAFASGIWGFMMNRLGRRSGLVLGMMLGVLGSGVAVMAVNAGALLGFLIGIGLVGAATAAMTLGRFTAGDVNLPERRGWAISTVVLGGTEGAIFGPILVAPAGQAAASRGMNELTGAYFAAILLFCLAGSVLFIWLRPEPSGLSRQVAQLFPDPARVESSPRPLAQILRQPAVIVAMLAMIFGQMVMGMVMVITSLHMRDHQHGLGEISFVISAHTVGMFAFSIISGRLADRWGRAPVIVFGSLTLGLACLAATLSPQVIPLAVALFLLGLGWNFCFVGGSTLLADQLIPGERVRTQGFNDMAVGLASALGSLGSGLVFAAVGYNIMALIGAGLALVPFAAALGWRRKARIENKPIVS
jgi:MFS family permease